MWVATQPCDVGPFHLNKLTSTCTIACIVRDNAYDIFGVDSLNVGLQNPTDVVAIFVLARSIY
jgi:hypothetical protein